MNSDFRDLLSIFNANGVKYLVIGAYAFMKHAEPRYTKDLDIWVKANAVNAARVFRSLKEFGAPLLDMTADDFAHEGSYYQLGVEPARIDILMSISGIEFKDAWKRRVPGELGEAKAFFISKEDLITAKLAAGRPQDLVDVQTLNTPIRKVQKKRVRRND
jgi:hypothetical protein